MFKKYLIRGSKLKQPFVFLHPRCLFAIIIMELIISITITGAKYDFDSNVYLFILRSHVCYSIIFSVEFVLSSSFTVIQNKAKIK